MKVTTDLRPGVELELEIEMVRDVSVAGAFGGARL